MASLTIKKWDIILRARFLIGSIIPLLFGIFWSLQYIKFQDLQMTLVFMITLGSLSIHLAANTFNDYFDWISGTDQINNNYIMGMTGGSRAIELKLISEKELLSVAYFFSFISVFIGIYLSFIKGPIVFILGIIGCTIAYFYTAPPIRLSARRGLGELSILVCFGPLIVAGITFVLTDNIGYQDFLIGLPLSIMMTTCLWVNEYPDIKSDAIAGKNNLAVIFGAKGMLYGATILYSIAYFIIFYMVFFQNCNKYLLLPYITLPLVVCNVINIYKFLFLTRLLRSHPLPHVQERGSMEKICLASIELYFCFGALFVIGMALSV